MFNTITINCNGLRDVLKIDYLKNVMSVNKIDVCFVQETHIDNVHLGNFVEKRLNARCFWSFTDNSKHKGVGLILNHSFQCEVKHIKFDYFGRYVCVDIDIDNYDFRLISVYAPNNALERKEFFNDFYTYFMGSKPIILGGDFNCIENLTLDKLGGNKNKGIDGAQQLKKIIMDFNLVDVYRKKFPTQTEYTWSSQGVNVRLDRFYISSCLFSSVTDISHNIYSLSDHLMVKLNLSSFNHQKFGKSYWKLNVSLLDDPEYIDYMNNFFRNNLNNIPNGEDILIWWDLLKNEIKSKTISFSSNRNKRQRFYTNSLRNDYMELIKEGNETEAKKIKHDIKKTDIELIKGAQIRSKILDLEGEKPSKYFLYKELRNSKRKHIKKIVDNNGKELTDSLEILDCFKQYYSCLFSREEVDDSAINDFLTDIPTISTEDSQTLGKDITQEEISISLKLFQNGKSPGSDGLPKEFYATFSDVLIPVLHRLYTVIYKTKTLTKSQKISYISLLCKDQNDAESMSNYRPISLLNVDYKILTKILSKRLEKFLHLIIHPDQTCAVPERSIIDNCHLLRDIIDYSEIKGINGILLSLDQEKAFDRVNHKYLFKVLEAFGLGEKFINWIKIFYNDISSCVIVNHYISESFPVTRSVRQGCCLSPLLYVLCLEPLLIKIRNDKNIKGFKMPGRDDDQKISAFADDSNFTILDDKSVRLLIDHFDYFGQASGSKLNKTKSRGMYMGKWKSRSDHPFGISWVDQMKVFGIMYGNFNESNFWNNVYRKIVNTLNLYRCRHLSLYGKAMIVNVMALSKLWYICSVLCVPERFIALIEKEIFRFVWSDRMELVNRNTCFLPKDKGGIALVDIRMKITSIQLCQISKIVYCQELSWTVFGNIWLGIQLHSFDDYNFSNSIPHCIEDLPNYYDSLKNTLNVIKNLDENISLLSKAHCKAYYVQLLDSFVKFQKPVIVEKHPEIDFNDVFINVCNKRIDPLVLDVTFKLAHGAIPVADRLYNFGIKIDRLCTFCKSENETISHLFFYCTHIQWCKKFLVSWLHDICDIGISKDLICFSLFPHKIPKHILDTCLILLSEYRFSIWTQRNKIRFDRNRSSPCDTASFFLNRVRNRIITDFHRFEFCSFHSAWMYKTLCDVDNGKLEFKFNL